MKRTHLIAFLATTDNADNLTKAGEKLKLKDRRLLNSMLVETTEAFKNADYIPTNFQGDEEKVWFTVEVYTLSFVVICMPLEHQVAIVLSDIARYDLDDLDMLRTVINDLNSSPLYSRLFYQFDETNSQLFVGAQAQLFWTYGTSDLLMVMVEELVTTTQCFAFQMKKCAKISHDVGSCDPIQKAYIMFKRHMLASASMVNKLRPADTVTFNPTDAYPLGLFLRVVCNLEGVSLQRFEVMGSDALPLHSTEVISAIDISRYFPADNSCAPFVGCIRYSLNDATEMQKVTGKGETGKVLTFTITAENMTSKEEQSLLVQWMDTARTPGAEALEEHVVRLMPSKAYPEERLMEFDYEWQEAREARAHSSAQQFAKQPVAKQMAALIDDDRVAYWTYWGSKAFLHEAWDTAIIHLENAWREMTARHARLSEDERLAFADVGYMLGVAHTHLQQWERAYFYLDGIQQVNRLDYAEAYVEMLCLSHDYRARPYLEAFIKNLDQQRDEEPVGLPEEVDTFYRHICQRLTEFYIIDQDYALARRLLDRMAHNKANAAFVRQQRRRLSTLDPKPPTRPDNSAT